jgi:hypothetical protein
MNRKTLGQGVAGAVGDGKFVLGIAAGSDLEAVADCGVKLLDGWIEAHALGRIDSIANQGFLPEADSWRAGVEIENLQPVASQCIHCAARVLRLFCRLCLLGVTSVAPAGVEDPTIIDHHNDDHDREVWQRAPQQSRSAS